MSRDANARRDGDAPRRAEDAPGSGPAIEMVFEPTDFSVALDDANRAHAQAEMLLNEGSARTLDATRVQLRFAAAASAAQISQAHMLHRIAQAIEKLGPVLERLVLELGELVVVTDERERKG